MSEKSINERTPRRNISRRGSVICERCKGVGWRMLIVGPHIYMGQAHPGGKAKYDCRACGGTGKTKETRNED